eukprot:scaffold87715_cov32-Tisochrysis_lutea.AAC.5
MACRTRLRAASSCSFLALNALLSPRAQRRVPQMTKNIGKSEKPMASISSMPVAEAQNAAGGSGMQGQSQA